jgi:hypothetical protein
LSLDSAGPSSRWAPLRDVGSVRGTPPASCT